MGSKLIVLRRQRPALKRHRVFLTIAKLRQPQTRLFEECVESQSSTKGKEDFLHLVRIAIFGTKQGEALNVNIYYFNEFLHNFIYWYFHTLTLYEHFPCIYG